MKKILYIITVIVLILSLIGCNDITSSSSWIGYT